MHTNDNEDSLGQKSRKRRKLMGGEKNDTKASYRYVICPMQLLGCRVCVQGGGRGSLLSKDLAPGTGQTQSDT